jgi:peptidoglycan-associated lipoprotein
MKPANYFSIALAILVMEFSVGCKKTEKPNTFLPSIKGGATTGKGGSSETGQGGKIGQQGNVTSTEGGEVNLTGLEDFENMQMDRESFATQTVYFGFDRSEIEPGDADKVSAVAEALSSSPQNKVLVEGHCDERGTEEYNRALGERRALSIRDILVEQGVSDDRIRTMTLGEDRPADPNLTETAYRLNRRGEFVLLTPNPGN